MSVWSVVSVNYNFQHLLKKDFLYSTSNHLFSSPMWRKPAQVNFRVKFAAPICASMLYKTIWGDHFLSYCSIDPTLEKDDMVIHEKLKEEVRTMLIGRPKVSESLEMIDAIQRLGVDYHFRTEIDQILNNVMDKTKSCPHGDDHDGHDDLHFVSLKFRVLRQQCYNISCDVFDKFKDSNGKFKDAIAKDARGMLSLYEATHLRTHKEEILDEALCFTTTRLKTMATELDYPISSQINNALNQPYYTGIPRLENWKYLHVYEDDVSCNDIQLSFAKLDFNLLQKLHQKEVGEMARWWKELDYATKLPFVRDRLAESYFWALGFYFEPEFSLARKIQTKAAVLSAVIDDIYDDYAPFEELQLFTAAFERWDLSEMKHLPEYMQEVYKPTIDLYSELDEIFAKRGQSYRSYYAKESMKQYIRAEFAQASWRLKGHMPTMDEYLQNIVLSTGYPFSIVSSLLGTDDTVTKHDFGWCFGDPHILRASSIMSRYTDDIVDNKAGDTNRNVISSIECYMNETNCTEEEAVQEFRNRLINLKKEINGEIMRLKSVPMPVITRILNLNRLIYALYVDVDNYTHAGGVMKDYVSAMLVDPIPM